MYIALEGVKGSGKSTLVKTLHSYYKQNNIPIKLACPTARGSLFNLVELLIYLFPALRHHDKVNEYLYALRSNLTALNIINYSGFILGDRSIVTSYAYRWNKWSDKNKFIERVDRLEFLMPSPDYIIYLDVKPEVALKRISERPKRNYGLKDETHNRISEVIESYKEIMTKPIERLKNSRWYIVNANKNFDYVFKECVSFINKIIELKFNEAEYEY